MNYRANGMESWWFENNDGLESIDKFKFFLDPQKRKYLIRKNILYNRILYFLDINVNTNFMNIHIYICIPIAISSRKWDNLSSLYFFGINLQIIFF